MARMDEKRKRGWKLASTVLLSLAAIVFFAAAYRFASHGITLDDNWCIGFGSVAFAVGALLLWFAFRKQWPKR
jgi:protein-S-isoprenylcysteine O-methyltransferase Ste14